MDALLKFFRNRLVTLAAGSGHVELEDWRLRVFGVENLVRAVAVGADRGFFRSGGDCVSVNALLVGGDHLRALSAVLHDKFLAVAGAAGGGDIGMVHA